LETLEFLLSSIADDFYSMAEALAMMIGEKGTEWEDNNQVLYYQKQ
jgi:hypothetical protein